MTDMETTLQATTERQTRNALRISIAMFALTGLSAIYYSYLARESNAGFNLYDPQILALMIAVASFVGIWLTKLRRVKLAMSLILGAFSGALLLSALFAGGMDIVLAFLLSLVFFGISSTTMSKKDVNRANTIGVILAFAIFAIGFWDPFERIYYPLTAPVAGITIAIALMYGFLIVRQYRSYSLNTKLILAFVSLSALAIGIAFTFTSFNLRQLLANNAQQRLLTGASASAGNIDAFLKYNTDSVTAAAAYLDFRAYLLIEPEKRRGTATERQVLNLLYALTNRNTDIVSYGVLDLEGTNIADANTKKIGLSEADQDYFLIPFIEGSAYVSPVIYLPGETEGFLFFSAPIYNDMGSMSGILRAQYRASALQELLRAEENLAGEGAYSILFDSNHIVLAHGQDEGFVGRMSIAPSTAKIQTLRENELLPENFADGELSLNLRTIDEGLNKLALSPYFSSDETETGQPIAGAIAPLKNTDWLVVEIQPEEIFLAPAREQGRRSLAMAIAVVILAALTGFSLSKILTSPILHLQDVAQRFAEGDLTIAADVKTEDEVGALANTFNALARQLGGIINTLEQRVQERTKDLEVRTSYLEGSAEISRAIGTIMDPDILIRQVVELIRERFDLYYVGLFLVDASNHWAVLKAGTGDAGQKMLKRGHQIKIGEGMIGWCIANAEARIALDVGEDAVRFDNPDLPETRSEGALPLRSRGRALGALTVQSREEAAFDPSILAALQTMTDQIAVALNNAELFAKTEAALAAERRAYGQISQQSWRALTQNQRLPRYRVQVDGTLVAVSQAEAEDAAEQEVIRRQLLLDDGQTVVIPIKSRDYVLGGIKVRKNEADGSWTAEQLKMIQSLSEQLSVALENARLLGEAQRRAAKERIISEGTTRVSAALDVESILQATAEELERALGGSEVIIQFEREE